MDRLVFLGTSHIAQNSIDAVQKAVQEDYDIIALELDKGRYHSLLHPEKKMRLRDLSKLGVKGLLFFLFASWGEKHLGKMVGTKPGDEMRAAVKAAKGKQIALIDQPIQVTLKRLGKALTWKEKFRFVKELFSKKTIPFDLKTVPSEEIITKMIEELQEKFPSLHRVLILERNDYMEKKLKAILMHHPQKRVLAIIGAGHVKDLEKRFEGFKYVDTPKLA